MSVQRKIQLADLEPESTIQHAPNIAYFFENQLCISTNREIIFYSTKEKPFRIIDKLKMDGKIDSTHISENYILVFTQQKRLTIFEKENHSKLFRYDIAKYRSRYQSICISEVGDLIVMNMGSWLVLVNPVEHIFRTTKLENNVINELMVKNNEIQLVSINAIERMPLNFYHTYRLSLNEDKLLALGVNDKLIAVGGRNVLKILDRYSEELISTIELRNIVHAICFGKDELYYGTTNGVLGKVEVKTKRHRELNISRETILSLHFDGKSVLAGTYEGKLMVINPNRFTTEDEIKLHSSPIADIVSDEFYIYATSLNGQTMVIDKEQWKKVDRMSQKYEVLAISNSEEFVYTAGAKREIIKWNKSKFEKVQSKRRAASNWITGIVGDNKYLYSCSYDGFVRIYTHNLNEVANIHVHCGYLYDIQISVDKIYVTTDEGDIIVVTKFPLKANLQRYDNEIHNPTKLGDKIYSLDSENDKIDEVYLDSWETETIFRFQSIQHFGSPQTSMGHIIFQANNKIVLMNPENESQIEIVGKGIQNKQVAGEYLLIKTEEKIAVYLLSNIISTN